jgi:hypothetical protein
MLEATALETVPVGRHLALTAARIKAGYPIASSPIPMLSPPHWRSRLKPRW